MGTLREDDEPPLAEGPQPASALLSRLANVFAAPGEVFDEIRAAPVRHANWIVPAVLFILASWLAAAMLISSESVRQQYGQLAEQALEQQVQAGRIPAAEAAAAREGAAKLAVRGATMGMIVWPIFGAFVSPFGWGLIIWLGVRVMDGRAGFMKAVEAAGLANTVLVLEPIVRALLVLGLDNVFASPSAALLIGQLNPGNALHWVLSTLNLMILWAVAVKAIGLARLAGVRFVNAALWAFGIWICYNGLFIGIGLGLRPVVSK